MDRIFVPAFLELTVAITRCWLNRTSPRDGNTGYLDQEVDKLSLLYACARHRSKPQPFTILPGIHGHGLAVVSPRTRSVFFPEALRLLVGLHAPVEDKDGWLPPDESAPFRITRSDFGYHFLPLKLDAWCDGQAKKMPEESAEFATDFSHQVAAFDSRQIIALGRHINAAYTREALNYLLKHTRGCVGELGRDVQESEVSWRHVRTLYELGREQRLKVLCDPEDYQRAWNDIAAADAPPNSAAEAILGCRYSPQLIWRRSDSKRWEELASRIDAFCTLVWAGFQISRHDFPLVGRTSPKPREEFEQAWRAWCSLGLDKECTFPGNEIADGRFMEVRSRLGTCLTSLALETESY